MRDFLSFLSPASDHPSRRAAGWLGLGSAAAMLVAFGSAGTYLFFAASRAAAAVDEKHPGIVLAPLTASLTERSIYPPGVAVGKFDGAYVMATLYKSRSTDGNKVALWGSEPGALKATDYPIDEFVYVLEGDVVTTDADGTRHEFHPGDSFVIPKGWVGTWDMKTRFKKIIVNF